MSAQVKGWCPSAHRPMMSGDGLLVRVRPRLARLGADAVLALCDLAGRFGNGMIDVTSRANLQIRGVSEGDYPQLLAALIAEGLVDADPLQEMNLTITPFWRAGDLTERMVLKLEAMTLPELPDKMGVVIDAGVAPVLSDVSGDFRFETDATGALLLRADGAEQGWMIAEQEAPSALAEMARWFLKTGGAQSGRMARHLTGVALPSEWQTAVPKAAAARPALGAVSDGQMVGVPFGQTTARALQTLITASGASHMRVAPWRMLILEEAQATDVEGFLSTPNPLLDVAACPGAPACAQASVATRDLARLLAPSLDGSLHVSGCAKGCARRAPASVTLVGRDGRFDLVRDGTAGDTPLNEGLDPAEILELLS